MNNPITPEEIKTYDDIHRELKAEREAVVCKELFGALTAKTVDFDMEMWRDQDSSCLLCHTPMGLDAGAEWPADPRLLLCWGCMSELCAELIAKLEAPNADSSDPRYVSRKAEERDLHAKICGQGSFAATHGSLSDFGSEILIATWSARAVQCDQTADQFAAVTKSLVCSFREKARAYRKCIEDLRRQMGHESERQPTENAALSGVERKL